MIFWLPFGYHIATNPNKNHGVDYVAVVTASFANSSVNPLIYFYRNRGLREALKTILTANTHRSLQNRVFAS